MKAVKKPIPITVLEFQPVNALPSTVKIRVVQRGEGFEVFNELHNSWIGVKPGDFLNISTPDDIYPIDRTVFANTYDVIAEPV